MFTTVKTKIANWLLEKKGHDLDISTSRGNYFFTLANNALGKFMNITWSEYSKGRLIKMYHSMAEIYAPVHHRAYRIAQGKYQLKKIANDEIVYTNEQINRLLEQPNPLQNWQELIYEMSALKTVTGESYLYANVPDLLSFNYKNIASLWNLPSDTVTIKTNASIKLLSATKLSDIIQSFDVSTGNSTLSIKPKKVLYSKYCSLYAADNKIFGKSPLLSAQKAMDNLEEVYAARYSQYKKRGALGFLTSRKSDADGMRPLTKPEKADLRKDYEDSYGTSGGKSPVGILGTPIDFVKVGATIAEMQPFIETEVSASAIYAVLDVPRSMMPRAEGATYENAKQDERNFYQNVVIPEAKSIAMSISNHWGLTKAGYYIDVTFDHIDVLQENKKEKSEVEWQNNETCRIRFLYGIITLNDWRVYVGLEKVTGNAIYDKLAYNMDETELLQVESIIKLSKGGNSSTPDKNNSDANK